MTTHIFAADTYNLIFRMELTTIPLSLLKENPDNPRTIRRDQFRRLTDSILTFPRMMEIRPIVVDGDMVALGGNMRLLALKDLAKLTRDSIISRLKSASGYHKRNDNGRAMLEAYWLEWLANPTVSVVQASGLSEEEKREFVIKDNASFGEWDWDELANEWDSELLSDWGMDIPGEDEEVGKSKKEESDDKDEDTTESEDKNEFYLSMLSDCLYESNNIFDIPNLLLNMQAGKLQLPFSPYGAESRQKKGIATYHFYVEDYRFEAIWKDPTKVLQSGCTSIVEPNLSLFDTTPVAWGLQQIYKKRWIARYFQECGIKVYADLNVARKFYEYNRMGILDGYNAFCTRGYAERIEYLKQEHNIAKEISGKDIPNLIVYGGGKSIREYCATHSLLYIEQLMTQKRVESYG